MCVVSNLGDDYGRTFPDRWPNVQPYIPFTPPPDPNEIPHRFNSLKDNVRECSVCGEAREHWVHALFEPDTSDVTKEDLDALRDEVESLKRLLKAAKIYDEETGQADCEVDEKVEFIKRLAKILDVDLEDLFD